MRYKGAFWFTLNFMAFFLSGHICGVGGEKKCAKMLQAKPSFCLSSPKVQHFVVCEVLLLEVCTLCMKKKGNSV